MSKTLVPVDQSPQTTDGPTPAKGPRPLDPSDWHHVAGGAPKGGWEAGRTGDTGPSAGETPAPKGGW